MSGPSRYSSWRPMRWPNSCGARPASGSWTFQLAESDRKFFALGPAEYTRTEASPGDARLAVRRSFRDVERVVGQAPGVLRVAAIDVAFDALERAELHAPDGHGARDHVDHRPGQR